MSAIPHDDTRSAADLTRRLCTLQAIEVRTARLLGGWLPGIEQWETKHAVAEHLWEDAEHSRALRTRLWELRVADADRDVGDGPRNIADALACAPDGVTFLAGTYLVLKRAVADAYETYLQRTHPVYDAPTVPILRRVLAEKEQQLSWAHKTVDAGTTDGEAQRRRDRWQRYVADVIKAHGGVTGAEDRTDPPPPPPGTESPLPFMEAKRDGRFTLALESGVPAEEDDRLGQVLYQFANYGAEMQAAETLGSILWEAGGMPWEFYYDLSRHAHDEARHAKLGETRLAELGHHLSDFPHSAANYTWRQMMDPLRRYCTLTYVIEADSFRYKHETYRQHLSHGDRESALAVLYDITDETMHVRWGKKWVPTLMKRYGYDGDVEALVRECREVTAKNSANPVQRAFAGEQEA